MPGGRPARLRRLRLGVGVAALTILAPLAVSSAAPAKAAPVVQRIVVVTVLPPGAVADGTTAAGLVATLNGPVRDFWQTQTGGAVDFTATAGAPGWVTTQWGCAPALPYNEVASAIGYVSGPNTHLLLYVPPGTGTAALPSCSDEGAYRAGPSFVMTGTSSRAARRLRLWRTRSDTDSAFPTPTSSSSRPGTGHPSSSAGPPGRTPTT